jgi:hypothetical protein
VRMRRRNPCVLARRRLLGWNVRLLTGTSLRIGVDGLVDDCCVVSHTRRPALAAAGMRARGSRRTQPDLATIRGARWQGQTSYPAAHPLVDNQLIHCASQG